MISGLVSSLKLMHVIHHPLLETGFQKMHCFFIQQQEENAKWLLNEQQLGGWQNKTLFDEVSQIAESTNNEEWKSWKACF